MVFQASQESGGSCIALEKRAIALDVHSVETFAVDNAAARLDALAALGDRSGVEEEAAPIS